MGAFNLYISSMIQIRLIILHQTLLSRMKNYIHRWPELGELRNDLIEVIEKCNQPADQILLDEADTLAFLKVTKRCLAKWRANGVLPYHKLGGKIYYIKSEIIEAVKKHSLSNKLKLKI